MKTPFGENVYEVQVTRRVQHIDTFKVLVRANDEDIAAELAEERVEAGEASYEKRLTFVDILEGTTVEFHSRIENAEDHYA